MADPAYCDRSDLSIFGTTAEALESVDPSVQDTCILGGSSLIAGALSNSLTLPLVSWGMDIRRAAAIIAAYDAITASRGRNPEDDGGKSELERRYDGVMAWLRDVAEGLPTSAVGQPVPGDNAGGGAGVLVSSNSQRGWQQDTESSGCADAFTGRRR